VQAKEARSLVTRLVKRTTGFPVQIERDASLSTLGTIKMARPSFPYHVIRYSPEADGFLDYVVCFQCGFAMRLVGVSEEDRYEVGPSQEGREKVARLVSEQFGPSADISLPAAAQAALSEQLLAGLVTQLRSIPLALRIDRWLRTEYAGLRDQQDSAMLQQLREGIAVLEPRVRGSMPKKIAEASVAMNAAQALYWSRVWGDEQVVIPYKASGLLKAGEALLQVWDELPGDPVHDRELIDAWGRILGISDWYEFVPFGEVRSSHD